MQAESGIVPDLEVDEEFTEEPKIYYELKSQPIKHRSVRLTRSLSFSESGNTEYRGPG